MGAEAVAQVVQVAEATGAPSRAALGQGTSPGSVEALSWQGWCCSPEPRAHTPHAPQCEAPKGRRPPLWTSSSARSASTSRPASAPTQPTQRSASNAAHRRHQREVSTALGEHPQTAATQRRTPVKPPKAHMSARPRERGRVASTPPSFAPPPRAARAAASSSSSAASPKPSPASPASPTSPGGSSFWVSPLASEASIASVTSQGASAFWASASFAPSMASMQSTWTSASSSEQRRPSEPRPSFVPPARQQPPAAAAPSAAAAPAAAPSAGLCVQGRACPRAAPPAPPAPVPRPNSGGGGAPHGRGRGQGCRQGRTGARPAAGCCAVGQCAICLDAVQQRAPRVRERRTGGYPDGDSTSPQALPCGHCFHAGCIQTWLAQSPTCPLCKSVVAGGGYQAAAPTTPANGRASGGYPAEPGAATPRGGRQGFTPPASWILLGAEAEAERQWQEMQLSLR